MIPKSSMLCVSSNNLNSAKQELLNIILRPVRFVKNHLWYLFAFVIHELQVVQANFHLRRELQIWRVHNNYYLTSWSIKQLNLRSSPYYLYTDCLASNDLCLSNTTFQQSPSKISSWGEEAQKAIWSNGGWGKEKRYKLRQRCVHVIFCTNVVVGWKGENKLHVQSEWPWVTELGKWITNYL